MNDAKSTPQTLTRWLVLVGLTTAIAVQGGNSWAQATGELPTLEPDATSPSSPQPRSGSDAVPADQSGKIAATSQSNQSDTANPRFFCQLWSGQYTVMYQPESRPDEVFPWATPQALGGGWDPEKRCAEISRRLEEYRPEGLQELRTDIENGYNTVCVSTQSNPDCRIVFTVPPGQDPMITRDSVFQNLTLADSGEMTEGVTTFNAGGGNLNLTDDLVNMGLSIVGGTAGWPGSSRSSGRDAIQLQPFLDPADGGTGAALRQGVALKRGVKLNPERFR